MHLISSSGFYGAERVVTEISKMHKKWGLSPIIGIIRNAYNPHTELARYAADCGLECEIFFCRDRWDRQMVYEIRRYIEDVGVDIIHSHGYKSDIYCYFSATQKNKIVATNHNWIMSNPKMVAYCMIDALFLRKFDCVVAVSKNVKNKMLRLGVPLRKITVIHNGVNAREFFPVQGISKGGGRENMEAKRKEKTITIGSLGSFKRQKGYEFLLMAFATLLRKYKNLRLILGGDGYLKADLIKLAKRLSVDKYVVFAGYQKDINRFLSSIDIFVISSIEEGLPMVLLEAMAAGKPVVTTNVGDIGEVIRNEVNGILVQKKNIDQLVAGIARLIDCESVRTEIGHRARETVISKFTSQKMAEKYLEIYLRNRCHSLG